jgi:dihydroorotate dehydrogenase (NAD+) catalytic subunit
MVNLTTEICGVKFKNPVILASGLLGNTGAIIKRVAKFEPGAITTKGIGPKNEGYSNPVLVEYAQGSLNAVGLPSPGHEKMIEELKIAREISIPLIVNIFGKSIEDYGVVAKAVSSVRPAIIEVNISCPHSKVAGQIFGEDSEVVRKVVETVKKNSGGIPVSTKLTPNLSASQFLKVAEAAADAGTDAFSAINTVGPGMVIDIYAKKPVLHNKRGGVEGPGIRPIAIRCVYDLYEKFKLPIIGMGGVISGKDAIEMMMAGASAVGVAHAVLIYGMGVFKKINKEIEEFMLENDYSSLKEIIGAAH